MAAESRWASPDHLSWLQSLRSDAEVAPRSFSAAPGMAPPAQVPPPPPMPAQAQAEAAGLPAPPFLSCLALPQHAVQTASSADVGTAACPPGLGVCCASAPAPRQPMGDASARTPPGVLSVPQPQPFGVVGDASARTPPALAMPGPQPQISFYQRYYSIDVECVASGPCHNDRVVSQISLVRGDGVVLLDLYVKPNVPVISYITPLTGLTSEMLEERGVPLETALAELLRRLPRYATLVGQGIENDVRWLGLMQGVDFEGMLDLATLWSVWNPKFQSWSVFSQEHLSKVLLGENIAGGAHNAVDDAIKAVKLFRLHGQLMQMGGLGSIEEAKGRLLMHPVDPPFKKRFPVYEGVCMGDRRTCRCGAQFLYA